MLRHRQEPTGFTLIELLLVVAVMGILAGLVLPGSDPGLHDQLRSAAQVMAADLAYGRSLAVTYNSHYRFTFETNHNRYVLEHSGDDPALDTLPPWPFRSPEDPPDRQVVDLGQLPHVGPAVRIAGVGLRGNRWEPVAELEFGPLGETTRSRETVIWLAAGSGPATRYVRLRVNPVTGLATVGAYGGRPPWSVSERRYQPAQQ